MSGSYSVEVPALPQAKPAKSRVVTQPVTTEEFELNRWPYLLALPVMYALTAWVIFKIILRGGRAPKINTMWFDGLGKGCRMIRQGAKTYRALEVIYGWDFARGSWLDNWWIGMCNAQAVRNRLKVARIELRRAIMQFADQGEVRVLSLAAGSAQALIEVMAELQREGIKVKATLLDLDPDALKYAKQLAFRHRVEVDTVLAKIRDFVPIARECRPHIVEMMGFLDYLNDTKAERTIRQIHSVLPDDGVFLTCNVIPNWEMWFLRWVIDWKMIYRQPQQLGRVMEGGGFTSPRLICEPHNIHCITVGTK